MKVTKVSTRGKQVLYQLNKNKRKTSEEKLLKMIASGELLEQKPTAKPLPSPKKEGKKPKKDPVVKKVVIGNAGDGKESLNWLKKMPTEMLEEGVPVVLATTFKAITANEEIQTKIKDTAKPGDVILVNEDDHLNSILTKTMADRLLKEGEFSMLYVLKSTYNAEKSKVENLEKEVEKWKARFQKANGEKRKAKSTKKEKSSAKKEVVKASGKTDKDKSGQEKPKPTPPKKSKAKCGIDALELAEISAKAISFLEKHSIKFHKIHKSKEWLTNAYEILGIYLGVGKAPSKIYVHLKNHKKGFAFANKEWHILCLDSFKLTRIEKKDVPLPQQRRQVVKQKHLKEIFTTKGASRFQACTAMYAELYKCQKEGNCSAEDKAKYNEIYETCGNLARKFEILKEQMNVLYDEAREIRDQEGLPWSEAIRKAVKEQKKLTNS